MFDPITNHLEQYMNLLVTRQKLVASNIANIDTPGYRSQDFDFQFEFLSHMDSPDKAEPTVFDVPGQLVHNDGNDVNLDREMKALSENAVRFTVASNRPRPVILRPVCVSGTSVVQPRGWPVEAGLIVE